jgi:hypothetical protein
MSDQPLSHEALARLHELLWNDEPTALADEGWEAAVRQAVEAPEALQPHGDAPLAELVPDDWPATWSESPSDLDGGDAAGIEADDAVEADDWAAGLFGPSAAHGPDTASPDFGDDSHRDSDDPGHHGFDEGSTP